MKIQYVNSSQLAEDPLLLEAKSTFALDVLTHVLKILKHSETGNKLDAEDFDEDAFWMLSPQHEYQQGKFLKTVDALVNLDCFHLTKYGTDLDGNSLYRRDDIHWGTQ